MEKFTTEMSQMYQRFTDYILDTDNQYAGVQNLATVVSFSVGAIVTILIIYIGWMYTSTKQDPQKRVQTQSQSQRQRTSSSLLSDCSQTAASPSDDPSSVSEKWPSDNPQTSKLPASCPLSKIYKDISKISNLLDSEGGSTNSDSTQPLPAYETDPLSYCDHLQGKYKRSQQLAAEKKIERDMTDEDKTQEREVRRKQLEDIYHMMEQNKALLGLQDTSQVDEQIKLYM